jgi:pyocin large subunit-like protein
MTPRALVTLIRHLPEDSATVKAQRGTHWSELMYLVAYIADTVTFARADYINAHGGNARPEPIQRPATVDDQETREQSRVVHDVLVDMMRGRLIVDAPEGDGRVYEPSVDVV